MDLDSKIFKDKTFSSLLEDIYKNSREKEKKIKNLIDDLKPFIKGPGDATILVPLIKGYLEQAIKNDDHLIKMAAIVQRALTNGTEGGDGAISQDERDDLIKLALEQNHQIEE